MKKVYVEMVGDLFHHGHAEFLKKARALGDYLIVGVLSDGWAQRYKKLPILTQTERAKVIAACRHVDEVILQDHPATDAWLRENCHVTAIALKDDADRQRHSKGSIEIDRSKEVQLPYSYEISSTGIIQRIQDRAKTEAREVAEIRRIFAPRWSDGEWLLAGQVLRELGEVLEEKNIPYFLTFGSLIGALRHGGVIPWDDDIDIAIREEEEPRFEEVAAALRARGLGLIRLENETAHGREIFYKVWILNRPSTFGAKISWPFVDIFVLRKVRGDTNIRRLDHIEFPLSHVFPLGTATFGAQTLPVPGKADALLRLLYKKDYNEVCIGPNFNHRDFKPVEKMPVVPAKKVRDAGCFVQVHQAADVLRRSKPIRAEGWALTEKNGDMRVSNGKTQLRGNAFLASLWKLLDGKHTVESLFAHSAGPKIAAMHNTVDTLSELKKQGAIGFAS